jgi:hypothetical protein
MATEMRLRALGAFLADNQSFWRAQPFYQTRPGWCADRSKLMLDCLALDDTEVEALASDNTELLSWAASRIPDWAPLASLIDLPRAQLAEAIDTGRDTWHVPGRKQAQIQAFAAAAGRPVAMAVEWCAGKGHLGRLVCRSWGLPVTSLDHDPVLCRAGQTLADRQGLAQRFVVADALDPDTSVHLEACHALALHACGDLHRALLNGVARRSVPALDLAPCCYYRTESATYQAYTDAADLRLSRADLHLAVTETVTAGQRERLARDQAMARKLGYLEWFRVHTGQARPAAFTSVPKAWSNLPYADYCRAMAARHGLQPAAKVDWRHYEALGWRRQGEVMRLSLVRFVFRRPLEIWLILDQALYLERQGYRVTVGEFCAPGVTPRNILISARLPTSRFNRTGPAPIPAGH